MAKSPLLVACHVHEDENETIDFKCHKCFIWLGEHTCTRLLPRSVFPYPWYHNRQWNCLWAAFMCCNAAKFYIARESICWNNPFNTDLVWLKRAKKDPCLIQNTPGTEFFMHWKHLPTRLRGHSSEIFQKNGASLLSSEESQQSRPRTMVSAAGGHFTRAAARRHLSSVWRMLLTISKIWAALTR